MKYNDEIFPDDNTLNKLTHEYEKKLAPINEFINNIDKKLPAVNNKLEKEFNNYIISLIDNLGKSIAFLSFLSNSSSKIKATANTSDNDINNAITISKDLKNSISKLQTYSQTQHSYVPYMPKCSNYHNCCAQLMWCQMEILRLLCLLKLLGYNQQHCRIFDLATQQIISILSIPLKVLSR